MPLNIMTNQGSISTQNTLRSSNASMQSSIERLSSGLRINGASDDAAGLAVSETMRAQSRGFSQAMRNANEGVAMLQTADSALGSVSDTLIRMRELAIQSGSDGLTDTERAYVDTEFQSLMTEVDRISAVTEYNGQNLLDGTAGDGSGTVTFQVGTRNTADNRITESLTAVDTTGLALTGAAVDTLANSQAAIDTVDAALDTLNTQRSGLGATINQLGSAIDNLGVTIENVNFSMGQIRDVDVAAESAEFSKSQILQQAGVAMLAQANAAPQLALRLLG